MKISEDAQKSSRERFGRTAHPAKKYACIIIIIIIIASSSSLLLLLQVK